MTFKLSQDRSDTNDYPESYYHASQNSHLKLGSLDGSTQADVCIIGGGYTGLSCALHLAKRGYRVILLEARKIGWGASGRNGGQLGSGQRKDQIELTKSLGADAAKRLWELAEDAKALAKQLISEHDIECDLKPGIAHPNHKSGYDDDSREYVDFLQQNYQYEDIQYLEKNDMADLVGSDAYFGGSFDTSASHLHPLNYALGLATAALKNGAILHEQTVVESFQEGKINQVITSRGTIEATSVVVACNGYLGKLDKRLSGKIIPINNFIIATKPLDDETVAQINPKDIAFADSRFVVNYFHHHQTVNVCLLTGENS